MIITLSHFSMFFQARRIPYGPKTWGWDFFISLPVDFGSHPHPPTPLCFQPVKCPISLLHLHHSPSIICFISSLCKTATFPPRTLQVFPILYDCWLNVQNSLNLTCYVSWTGRCVRPLVTNTDALRRRRRRRRGLVGPSVQLWLCIDPKTLAVGTAELVRPPSCARHRGSNELSNRAHRHPRTHPQGTHPQTDQHVTHLRENTLEHARKKTLKHKCNEHNCKENTLEHSHKGHTHLKKHSNEHTHGHFLVKP